MDIAFTRQMEEQLDQIEEQHLDWVRVLKEFYGPFKENLDDGHRGDEARQGRGHAQRVHLPGLQAPALLQIREERQVPELLGVSGVQIRLSLRQGRQDDAGRGQRAQVPQVRQADGPQERPVRHVPGVQRLSRLQDDAAPGQGGQPPAAEAAGRIDRASNATSARPASWSSARANEVRSSAATSSRGAGRSSAPRPSTGSRSFRPQASGRRKTRNAPRRSSTSSRARRPKPRRRSNQVRHGSTRLTRTDTVRVGLCRFDCRRFCLVQPPAAPMLRRYGGWKAR